MRHYVILTALLALIVTGCGRKPTGGSGAVGTEAPDTTGRMNLVLARVGDMAITAEDVKNHMLKMIDPAKVEGYLRNPDVVQVGLASLVDQFVWAERARRAGFKLTQSERHQVAAAEAQFLARRYVADVVQSKAKPSRGEIEEFYAQHQDLYLSPTRVAVRHILVGDEAEARRVMQEARAGADFASLVKRYSKDEATRSIGGALGFIQKDSEIIGIGRNGFFTDKVLSMNSGDVDVVQTNFGWHVVKVEKKEGGDLFPLDQVYDKIEAPMLKERYSTIYNDELAKAREDAGVKYDTANFGAFVGVPDNCERLMQLASQAPDEISRIETYRRVSSDFPDCERAPEAQFMIGYVHLKRGNKPGAQKAFLRLQSRFGNSEWRRAGDYLLGHLDDDPADLGTPEEVRAKASR